MLEVDGELKDFNYLLVVKILSIIAELMEEEVEQRIVMEEVFSAAVNLNLNRWLSNLRAMLEGNFMANDQVYSIYAYISKLVAKRIGFLNKKLLSN